MIQERRDAGKVRFRKGGMLLKRNSGKEGCWYREFRKGWLLVMRESGKEGCW